MKSQERNYIYSNIIIAIKMCKHEFFLSRALVIITIVSTVLNILLFLFNNMIEKESNIIGLIILLQFFVIGTFIVIYYFSAAISFYHGIFGRNAYLTHSLPIPLNAILISKIFIFMLWACVGCAELLLFFTLFDKIFYDSSFTDVILSISYMNATKQYNSIGEFFSYLCLYCFLFALSELMLIFMVTAIAHKIKSYMMIYGIIVFFIIQGISFYIFSGINEIISDINSGAVQIGIKCAMLLVFFLMYYFVCHWIIKNKLSL